MSCSCISPVSILDMSIEELYPKHVRDVVLAVTDYFEVTPYDLKGSRRGKTLARARGIAYWLCREVKGMSLPEVGSAFGKDQSTVRSVYERLKSRQKIERLLQQQMESLTAVLRKQPDEGVDVKRVQVCMPAPMYDLLIKLKRTGLFGVSAAHVAERLLAQKLYEMTKEEES